MKKTLILIMMLFAIFFGLASCQTDSIQDNKNNDFNIIYYVENDEVYLFQNVDEGELILEPDSPNKENYEFEYWTFNSTEFSFDTIINKDIKLYAVWESNKIDVKLHAGDTLLDELQIDINSTITNLSVYDDPDSDGQFLGWFLDKELTNEFNIDHVISANLTLYGKWELNPDDNEPVNGIVIFEDGVYTSKDEVALYIVTFHKLPSNYMTKAEANGNIKGLWTADNKASIGGDVFGNWEGLLPNANGRTFTELDIDYYGVSRGSKRIVYSSDFRIFYTDDHYDSFVEYDKETGEWNSY